MSKPAFPRSAAEYGHGGHYEQDGMTLREYYAGIALSSMGTWCPGYSDGQLANPETLKQRALVALQQADALIALLEAEQMKAVRDDPF